MITGLIVVLAFLVFKLFMHLSPTRKHTAGKPETPLLISEMLGPPVTSDGEGPPPQSQFHDLDQPENPIKDFNLFRITIGRDENNDFVIPQSTISTLHAKIEYRDKLFFLEDLRSTNGTRLNGRKIPPGRPTLIKSGDRIKFADREFKFERPDHLISGNTVCLTVTNVAMKHQDLDPSVVIRADDETLLDEALLEHLKQIKALGARYDAFVDQHFTPEVIQSLTLYAQENMRQTITDSDQHCSTMINGQAYFVVCTLPVPIAHASAWFSKRFEGFCKFILKWIRSDAYDVATCDVLCIITFGFDKGHWVSATIIPTNNNDDEQLEIVSVEFLTESEKAEMGIEFDKMGRVL
jgi:pSer/pThr/pTyr-binding forkhead associated (FHA) protein